MSAFQVVFRLAAPVALLAAAGCAQNFNAKVSRFQAMPAPQGQSFIVKASDPRLEGGLEFSHYAAQVSDHLRQQGYQPAANDQTASLIVSLDYGVDQGRERVRSVPAPYYGPCGGFYDPWCYGRGYWPAAYRWRGGAYRFGYYDPFLFDGFGEQLESYTVYTSGLNMKIARAGSGERVFEGKAQAQSLNDNLAYLVPNLIDAMFTGFPGNSGETVRITVAPPKKK